MSKIALMFPGVGSHYLGMGKYYYDNFNTARETFEEASEVLNLNFSKICFEVDSSKKLNDYENSQTALVCVGMAIYRVLRKETGLVPDYCMGYSLGEYTALCCAGMLAYADVLKLVRDRSRIIKEVSSKLDGTMAWSVNLNVVEVERICKKFRQEGFDVYLSACDCPDKASISATPDAILAVGNEIVNYGGILIPIKMSGPYHSPLMAEASEKLRNKLNKYKYNSSMCEVIANRNAKPYKKEEDIIENLSLQLVEPIQWKKSIDYIIENGCKTAIEIGPKNVLTYLLKRNTSESVGYATDSGKDYTILQERLFVNINDCIDIVANSMTTITSTKNYNFNDGQYEECVIKPYRELEKTYQMLVSGSVLPNIEQAKSAIHILQGVLKAKGIPDEEQQRRINSVLQMKHFMKR